MKIRTITCFCDPGWPLETGELRGLGKFTADLRAELESAGYEVQTARLATTPFPHLIPEGNLDSLVELTISLEDQGLAAGFDYLSLGPALPEHPHSFQAIPEALGETENVFFSGSLSTHRAEISLSAARACAEIIQKASSITQDGFTNLRFAALANVPPGAPFFPASYHGEGETSFALGMQAADLAVEAVVHSKSLHECRLNLVEQIEKHAGNLTRIAEDAGASSRRGIKFGGIDFTLAPFPEVDQSIGAAIERLGIARTGQHGSLAAAAFFTNCLKRAEFQKAGFNGLFMPVLEDAVLAERAGEGTLTIPDLLLYSAVCGTGLDTIPLPGDTTAAQIYPLLLDLAALAHRLDKPLTARLMPLPGKAVGDPTSFDFPFFANSRVMRLEALTLAGLLGDDQLLDIS
jgi:hypothetical protein